MAAKTTIRGRVIKIAQANINSMIEKRVDPMKMLDLSLHELQKKSVETERLYESEVKRVADTRGRIESLNASKNQWEENITKVAEVYHKYNDKIQNMTSESPDYFSTLKKRDESEALMRQALIESQGLEDKIKAAQIEIDASKNNAEKIRKVNVELQRRFDELNAKKTNLKSRHTMIAAEEKTLMIEKMLDTNDSTSIINILEEDIKRKEYTLEGQREIRANSLDAQFAELDMLSGDNEIENRLREMKENKALSSKKKNALES